MTFIAAMELALNNFLNVWTNMMNLFTGNAVLMISFFGGLVAMTLRHFGKAKKAVRG